MTPHQYLSIARRASMAALAFAAGLGLAACDQLPFGYTTAKEIIAAPGPFDGKEVKVKGKAGDPVQFFGLRMFTVVDETGQIQVSTAGALPAAGAEVAVKGIVRSAVIVGGKSIGLHVEETQRLR
jgi:cytochrome c-type biogenesis protein CcmE